MTSGTLSETNTNCKLEFWYYMTGVDIGSLSVWTSQGMEKTSIWYVSGSQGSEWKQAEMKLGAGTNYSVSWTILKVSIDLRLY